MEFRFDDDQLAMRDAVRAFCADHLDLTRLADREGKAADPATWSALADLGVLGMLAGGDDAGVGLVEASIVFEALGANLVSGPVLWSTLTAPLIDGIADGAVRAAGVTVPEGADGTTVVEHAEESELVVVLRADRVVCCRAEDLPAPIDGSPLDPLTPVTVFSAVPDGEDVGGPAEADALRRAGTLLSAAMLVGAAQGALDVARDYALERRQFDRPIGSFQAVKHLLADMYVRVELARAATYAAAAVAAGRGTGDVDHSTSTAKLLAGEAGLKNSRSAIQILGGMGFTWDMLPHYFLKRAWVLEEQFGTSADHATRLGSAVGREVSGT